MGPWTKKLVEVLGGEQSDLAVEDLRVEPGLITARVEGETVTISAPTIRPRLWAAIESYARGRGSLERAVRGEVQSEHLLQIMEQDWDEPLVPARESIVSVGEPAAIRAAARAVVDEVDEDPAVLLRWRGCLDDAGAAGDDPWRGSTQPALPPKARRPPQSVPQRFGASGIRDGGDDLVEVLVRVYETFG